MARERLPEDAQWTVERKGRGFERELCVPVLVRRDVSEIACVVHCVCRRAMRHIEGIVVKTRGYASISQVPRCTEARGRRLDTHRAEERRIDVLDVKTALS